jgi:cob(I)alamin adenosyltransferase
MLSISTKTGDLGESGLANGQRLPKHSLVFEVLGSLDELNSWLGVVVAELVDSDFSQHTLQRAFLLKVQDTLFYIGAELAQSPKTRLKKSALSALEKTSAELQENMRAEWTTTFLLPGGSLLAAHIDVARAVSRRVERVVVQYARTTLVSPLVLQYLNRLSDYLYLLRCEVNLTKKVGEKPFIVNTK